MKLGFTGTREGMTKEQKAYVRKIFRTRLPVIEKGQHGDCVGADDYFHQIAQSFGVPIVIHLPLSNYKRAFCKGAAETRKPKDYIPRDRDIVDETDILIATPKGFEEELRSGTWTTIRYATKIKKMVVIIYPDGTIEVRNKKEE